MRNETQYLLPRSNATKILHKIYLNNLHNTAPMSERLYTKNCFLFLEAHWSLNLFSPITEKISNLRHMLLRKSYINMPIAVLLRSTRRLYHVPIKSKKNRLSATPKMILPNFSKNKDFRLYVDQ